MSLIRTDVSEGEDRALLKEDHIYRPRQSRWRDKRKQSRWETEAPKPAQDRTNVEIRSTSVLSMVLKGVSSEEPRKAGACLKMVATLSLSGYKTGRRSLKGDHRQKQSERPNVNNSFGRTQISARLIIKTTQYPNAMQYRRPTSKKKSE